MKAQRTRFWPIIATLAVVAATAVLLLRHKDKAVIETLRQEAVALRLELEARDKSFSELQAKLEESLKRLLAQPPTLSPDLHDELVRRVDQLTVQQNKTAALVESLAQSKPETPTPPEQTPQQRQLAITVFNARLKTEQDKLDLAKQKIEQLMTTWRVSDEVSRMDVAVGLDSAALKQYWPYFEAKRERDELQRTVSLLKMRILSDQIALDLETAKRDSQ